MKQEKMVVLSDQTGETLAVFEEMRIGGRRTGQFFLRIISRDGRKCKDLTLRPNEIGRLGDFINDFTRGE